MPSSACFSRLGTAEGAVGTLRASGKAPGNSLPGPSRCSDKGNRGPTAHRVAGKTDEADTRPPGPAFPTDPKAMVIRCRTCARGHSDGPCRGSPQEGSCYCQQCHTHVIMAMAREALESSNNLAKIRAALAGVYALQFQTMTQRQRKAFKAPAVLACASCGKPVQVRRRPNLGQPVYCRRPSTCRWRAWAKRQRAQVAARPTQTPGQIPEPARGQVPEPSPAELWLAARAG